MNKRIEKLMARLPKEIDCALILSDLNRRYFSGMRSSAGTVVCFRDAAYLIIDFRYIEKARQASQGCIVIQQENLYTQLRELFAKHGCRRAAVEAMELTLSQFAQLREKLSDCAELDDSNALSQAVYECRMVKEPEELEKIRSAQQLAETAFDRILTFIRPGVTEREIQMELDFTMIRLGAEDLSFSTIALTGSNTSMPHGVPSSRTVKKGDFVLMDYGAVVDGYHSDMTRTVAVGQPSEEMERVYHIVLEAQKRSLDAVHAGMTGQQLDAVARTHIAQAGYGEHFGHSLGHGVGLEIHEYPNAAPSSTTVLRPGHVITIEPGIYLPGEFGVRIEDFAAVTENGCENLTKASKELIIL